MPNYSENFRFGLLFFLIILINASISACSGKQIPEATPTPSRVPLTPYHSMTPEATLAGEEVSQPVAENPTPTITPFLYRIQSGDTLSVVAFRHNVNLQELFAANPGINPNFLIVGEEIIIPTGEGEIASIPTPTPVTVDIGTPYCFPNSDSSSWCFVSITNPNPESIENVSAMVSIFSPEGNLIEQRIAIAPMNLVNPGASMLLAALFPISIKSDFHIEAKSLTSIPVSDGNSRYLNHDLHIQAIDLFGIFARVRGIISISGEEEDRPAKQIWIAAIAYDKNEIPIGFRKIQINEEIPSGNSIEFEISVYSVGEEIANVIVFGEARP